MKIMELDNITPLDIMTSLSVDMNHNMVFKAGQGAGLSGSFFFFSYDNRFIIKTVNEIEMERLLNMLDSLIEHFEKTNNRSLIARIYGVFTIKTNLFDPLNIIIMQNTSKLTNPKSPKVTFDIKGSTINRKVNTVSRFWQN
jgi:pantothenate kinase